MRINQRKFIAFLLSLILILFVSSFRQVSAGEMILWEKSLKEAREASSSSGKLILLYFQSGEKEQTNRIEDSFYDLGLIALTKKFSCLKVGSDESQDLAREYGIKAFPAFLVALPSGKRLTCLEGPREYSPMIISAFLELAGEALKAVPPEPRKIKKQVKKENLFIADFSGQSVLGNLSVSYPGCFFSDQDDISFHLRVVHPTSSSLEANFSIADEPKNVALKLKHMTSRSGDFPGWAPISIMINGNYLIFHQDIGSNNFPTMDYDITQYCVRGQNTILWQLSSDARTNYCIKEIRVEIQP
ncbi:MAG: hypothetical protein V2A78_11100 [bacterium]